MCLGPITIAIESFFSALDVGLLFLLRVMPNTLLIDTLLAITSNTSDVISVHHIFTSQNCL